MSLVGNGVIARRNVVHSGTLSTSGDIGAIDITVVGPAMASPGISAWNSHASIRGNRRGAAASPPAVARPGSVATN